MLLRALACMILHGVLLLHRLAGPVYRIQVGLEDLSKRDLSRKMFLRDRDYLKPMVGLFNGTVDRLKGDIEAASAETAAIRTAAEDRSEKSQARLVEHLEKLEGILGAYRLEQDAPAPAEAAAAPEEAPALPAGRS